MLHPSFNHFVNLLNLKNIYKISIKTYIYIFKIFRNVYAKFITPRDVTSNIASFISFQTLAPASAFILEASH